MYIRSLTMIFLPSTKEDMSASMKVPNLLSILLNTSNIPNWGRRLGILTHIGTMSTYTLLALNIDFHLFITTRVESILQFFPRTQFSISTNINSNINHPCVSKLTFRQPSMILPHTFFGFLDIQSRIVFLLLFQPLSSHPITHNPIEPCFCMLFLLYTHFLSLFSYSSLEGLLKHLAHLWFFLNHMLHHYHKTHIISLLFTPSEASHLDHPSQFHGKKRDLNQMESPSTFLKTPLSSPLPSSSSSTSDKNWEESFSWVSRENEKGCKILLGIKSKFCVARMGPWIWTPSYTTSKSSPLRKFWKFVDYKTIGLSLVKTIDVPRSQPLDAYHPNIVASLSYIPSPCHLYFKIQHHLPEVATL